MTLLLVYFRYAQTTPMNNEATPDQPLLNLR